MSAYIDKPRIKIGMVLYHRIDNIEATVIGFDEKHIHVRYNKKLDNQIESKYRYGDIGVQLFFSKEEVTSDAFEKNQTERVRRNIEEEKRLEREKEEKIRLINKERELKEKQRKEEEEKLAREKLRRQKEIEELERKRKEERRSRELRKKEEEEERKKRESYTHRVSWREDFERRNHELEQKRNGCKELEKYLQKKGFEGLCHYTDISNLRNVFDNKALYSRHVAEEKGILVRNAADAEVLSHTQERVKSFVRMYFFPNTPTVFKWQGIHSVEEPGIAHMPIPVLLLFDPVIMSHKGVWFLDGNAASTHTKWTNDVNEAREQFNWDNICERTPLRMEDDRFLKIRQRNAEFLYPFLISAGFIRKIIFRSEAEYKNALYLYGDNPLFSCDPNKFPDCPPFNDEEDKQYYRNYLMYYHIALNKKGMNGYNLHLEVVFKNSNAFAYDRSIVFRLPSGKIKKTDKKTFPRGDIYGPQKLVYDIPLTKQQTCFELQYYLNDTCVLYYKR
ncbi:MAG: DUF4433 domain-containing protein [Firmicutes bacterium]|nr:DUF4433 domain-containing protein [Bacillota bacterium]